ncbi:MAG: DUF952 domain-containing protein [Waterburya sp.]
METVFHIVAKKEVDNAQSEGYYQPASFVDEGFIHCSYLNQVCRVANLFYRGKTDLVLLEINTARIGCEVIDEDLYDSGENFPHIYGKLSWEAVVAVHEFPCNTDGTFELPTTLKN